MEIRKLNHVATLAKAGTFARAADLLGITQSALTRSIQAIEEELGLRLFDRGRSGAVVTKAGAELVRQGEIVLQGMRTLENNMAMLSRGEAGDVSFGMGPLPASIILPNLLGFAANDHPGIKLKAQIGSLSELLAALKSDRLEFVILSHLSIDEASNIYANHRIGRMKLVGLVRKDHPLITKPDFTTARDYPLLGGTPLDEARQQENAAYNPTIMCDNYHVLRDVTLNSDAIWITADCMAHDGLVPLKDFDIAQPLQIVAVSMPGRHLSPSARLFIDKAAAILKEY